ncbi:MAG: hypothetical protein HY678_10870 [Chloroflexi bacterium]|nr:hypothetical protein [Chloroflexota bacterium]
MAPYSRLDRKSFVGGIENITDVENRDEPHSVERYLQEPEVVRLIAASVS